MLITNVMITNLKNNWFKIILLILVSTASFKIISILERYCKATEEMAKNGKYVPMVDVEILNTQTGEVYIDKQRSIYKKYSKNYGVYSKIDTIK